LAKIFVVRLCGTYLLGKINHVRSSPEPVLGFQEDFFKKSRSEHRHNVGFGSNVTMKGIVLSHVDLTPPLDMLACQSSIMRAQIIVHLIPAKCSFKAPTIMHPHLQNKIEIEQKKPTCASSAGEAALELIGGFHGPGLHVWQVDQPRGQVDQTHGSFGG